MKNKLTLNEDFDIPGADEAADMLGYDPDAEPTLEDQGWEYVASKDVYDENGFRDSYMWYRKDGNNRFFFSSDVDYGDPEYFDWETEGDEAAQEWFDSYGEDEDDLTLVDNREAAILGKGDDPGFDEYDRVDEAVEDNTTGKSTKEDILEYAKLHGDRSAADLLLLGGYEFFDGTADEYDVLLKELEGKADSEKVDESKDDYIRRYYVEFADENDDNRTHWTTVTAGSEAEARKIVADHGHVVTRVSEMDSNDNPIDESFNNSSSSYYLTTVGDMIDGSVGNMDDEDIDKDLKFWRTVARTFNFVPGADNVAVLIADGEYDPEYYYPSWTNEPRAIAKKYPNAVFYDVPFFCVKEVKNGKMFLYFDSEESAKKYVDLIDSGMDLEDQDAYTERTEKIDGEESATLGEEVEKKNTIRAFYANQFGKDFHKDFPGVDEMLEFNRTAKDLGTVFYGFVSLPLPDEKYFSKKTDESLKEDLTPEDGEETFVASNIITAIEDEWKTISLYNNIITTLSNESDDKYKDIIPVIQDIVEEENVHVGQLQKALETISPDTAKIQSGEVEADGQLQKGEEEESEEPTVESLKESIGDDDWDDFEQAGIYGGDLTYCPICGRRLQYDEDGDQFCPKCEKSARDLAQERRKRDRRESEDFSDDLSDEEMNEAYNYSTEIEEDLSECDYSNLEDDPAVDVSDLRTPTDPHEKEKLQEFGPAAAAIVSAVAPVVADKVLDKILPENTSTTSTDETDVQGAGEEDDIDESVLNTL